MKNKLDYARELDVYWWSYLPEIKNTADFLMQKISKNNPEKLKINRLKNHLKVLLTNLFLAHRTSPKLYISFSLDKNEYRVPRKFKKIYLNFRYISFLVEFLLKNGLIEIHRGINFSHFRRRSRMRATQKLLRLFRKYRANGGQVIRRVLPLILRDKDKNPVDFPLDTLEIHQMAKNVNRINKSLSRHTVIPMVGINDYVAFMKDFAIYKDFEKYTRIFNNSDFAQGGRFYGHWSQMIKSEYRKYITIDGRETVELDYSCLHISMLYGLVGLVPPDKDLYELAGIGPIFRPIIKKAVNIAINARDERSAIQALRLEYSGFTASTGLVPPHPKEILEAIKTSHNVISKFFCSGYGVYLQNIDSSIAEKIMLDLADDDICCLCIHDSFIVCREYQDKLEILMKSIFRDRFGFVPRVTSKNMLL